MSNSLTGDGAPKELREQADAETSDAEAVRLANEGARRVFCPRCERGHEGPCTGPAEFTRVNRGPSPEELDRMDAAIASHYADEADGMGTSPETSAALHESALETARAIQAERRAAYLAGTPDEHHPDL